MDGDGQRGGSAGPSPGPRLVDATLLDHLGDGICVLDGNWSFVLVNEVAARMVGGTPVGLVGRSIWDVLPGAAGSDLERQLRRALDHQEPVDVEVHLEALDRWFSVRAVPTPGGMTVDFQDSSARHAADRALGALLAQSRRQQRLAAVLAETNEAVFRSTSPDELFAAAVRIAVDHGGFVMSWIGVLDAGSGALTPVAAAGAAAHAYLDNIRITANLEPAGLGPAGVAIRAGTEVCSNDILVDANMALWRGAAAKAGYRSSGAFPLLVGGAVRGLMSVYAEEPGYFDTDEVLLVRRLAANVAFGWEGLLREEALRDSEVARRAAQRFRAMLAAAPDAILGVTPAGVVQLVNARAEHLFGCRAADLVGTGVGHVLPDFALPDLVPPAAGPPAAGPPAAGPPAAGPPAGPPDGLELAARRLDGSTFPAEVAVSRVGGDDRDPLVLVSVRDLTDRYELEAERHRLAVEAERERSDRLDSLGKLAGGVAHDFNNLLGVILNYTALLDRQVAEGQAHEDLGEIRAAAQRGAALTKKLLSFARREPTRPEPIDLNACVRGVAAVLTRTLPPSIALRLHLDPGPLVTVMDRYQLDQLVLNLAINARDAMAGGGTLTLSTERRPPAGGDRLPDGPAVALTVADTGAGMAPEVAARAFEPFFTTKPPGEGTGLGLAAVHGIASRSGGRAELRSTPGAGTAVTVVLPLADPLVAPPVHAPTAPRATVASPDDPPRPAAGSRRVLLVEDDLALRDATARVVAAAGYRVLVASDGVEALDVLDRNDDVGLVLSDLVMPRLRGDELAAVLAERSPSTTVVLMTGDDPDGLSHDGPVVLKPVDDHLLVRLLHEALDG